MTFIYVMTIEADLIKIGFAADPAKRLRQLRRETGKRLDIFAAFDCGRLDHRRIERAIHIALKDRCVYREVFRMAPDDTLAFIAKAFGLTPLGMARRRWVSTLREHETEEPTLDVRVCRAARVGNGWTTRQLAELSGVSSNTIVRFEKGRSTPHGSKRLAIQRALEAGKVRWWSDENGKTVLYLGSEFMIGLCP